MAPQACSGDEDAASRQLWRSCGPGGSHPGSPQSLPGMGWSGATLDRPARPEKCVVVGDLLSDPGQQIVQEERARRRRGCGDRLGGYLRVATEIVNVRAGRRIQSGSSSPPALTDQASAKAESVGVNVTGSDPQRVPGTRCHSVRVLPFKHRDHLRHYKQVGRHAWPWFGKTESPLVGHLSSVPRGGAQWAWPSQLSVV